MTQGWVGTSPANDVELAQLLLVMDQVSEQLRYPIELEQSLQGLTAGAGAAVPGIDHASISVTDRKGRIQTLAPTDSVSLRADELQYELSEGPCLDAVTEAEFVQVDDIANDPRWPRYGPRVATGFGVRSQLAFQFHAEPHVRGGFNLYSDRTHQIGDETRQLGAMFANLAAVALGWTRHSASLLDALESRDLIGRAIGIVMERYRLDSDRASGFLVRTSSTSNIKLREVAAAIVADTEQKSRTLT
jgi:hypothetical protein